MCNAAPLLAPVTGAGVLHTASQVVKASDKGRVNSGEIAGAVCIVLLSLLLQGCTRPSVHEPVTLTLLEEWSNKTFSEARQQELQQFTRETGIRVSLLPSPESARKSWLCGKSYSGQAPRVLTCTASM